MFQWSALLGDLGGILGLYIGCSVMTLLEFGELVCDLLALFIFKLRKGKETQIAPHCATGNMNTSKTEVKQFQPSEEALEHKVR